MNKLLSILILSIVFISGSFSMENTTEKTAPDNVQKVPNLVRKIEAHSKSLNPDTGITLVQVMGKIKVQDFTGFESDISDFNICLHTSKILNGVIIAEVTKLKQQIEAKDISDQEKTDIEFKLENVSKMSDLLSKKELKNCKN